MIVGDDGRSGSLTITDGTVDVRNNSLLVSGLGTLRGDGQIIGNVDNFGAVAPGISAGTLHINGNYTQRDGGSMHVEIGGTTPGSQFDTLDITGHATLDGTLSVSLLNGFTPASGTVFEILHANQGISGFFDNLLFPPGPGWAFVDTGFRIFLIAPGPALPGDFNANGVVDAADYVLWRNGGPLANDTTPGVQPSDYNVWKIHFGQTVGSGSSSAFPLPPSPFRLPPLTLPFPNRQPSCSSSWPRFQHSQPVAAAASTSPPLSATRGPRKRRKCSRHIPYAVAASQYPYHHDISSCQGDDAAGKTTLQAHCYFPGCGG